MTARLRRDPAPSRLAYRMERIWLRPLVRRAVRLGLPLAACAAALSWYVADPERIRVVTDTAADLRRAVETRPEFMVRLMAIDGASPELAHAVRETVHLDLPLSSFDIDLDRIRREIGRIDAVAEVAVRIRAGGTLQIDITEREPALVWRAGNELMLVDATGHPIAATPVRADWPELPLIAGEGANDAAPEALALFEAAAPLALRLRGLQRRGERRWDVVLTRDQRILLPGAEPVAALERLLAVDKARDLLARDVTHVDLRLPDRPTLRLSEGAMAELVRIRSLETVGE
jgi:cell division protein FtsQ